MILVNNKVSPSVGKQTVAILCMRGGCGNILSACLFPGISILLLSWRYFIKKRLSINFYGLFLFFLVRILHPPEVYVRREAELFEHAGQLLALKLAGECMLLQGIVL